MKVKVTFPGDAVEFDVKDIPELLRLCENARCFKEDGYGRSKYRTYVEEPITMELPVVAKVEDETKPQPSPSVPAAEPALGEL